MKVGPFGLYFLILAALKVTNVADVPWWQVFAPLFVWFILTVAIETKREADKQKRLGRR